MKCRAAVLRGVGKDWEIQLSVAQELFSDRTSQTYVDPDQERILRFIGEISWDFSDDHALELFGLRAIDSWKMLDNLRRSRAGLPLVNVVDRRRGY